MLGQGGVVRARVARQLVWRQGGVKAGEVGWLEAGRCPAPRAPCQPHSRPAHCMQCATPSTQPNPCPSLPAPPLCSFMVLQRKDPEAAKALHELMDTDVSAVLCLLLCCNCIPACPIQPLPRPHSCLTLAQPTYHPPVGCCRSSCATSGWWPCPRSRWWRERPRKQLAVPAPAWPAPRHTPHQDPPNPTPRMPP